MIKSLHHLAFVLAFAVGLPGLQPTLAGPAHNSLAAPAQQAPGALPTPLGYWRMHEFLPGSTLNSVSNTHDAAISGPLLIYSLVPDNNVGWIASESTFNNTASLGLAGNTYLTVTSSTGSTISRELSIAAWVYLSNPVDDQKILGRFWLNFPQRSGYLLSVTGGQVQAEIYDSSGSGAKLQAGQVPANTWTHIAMTWEAGGALVAYVNGVEVGRQDMGALPIGTKCVSGQGGCNIVIGTAPWDLTGHRVIGNIDEVLVYDTALSAAQIAQVAQRTFIVNSAATDLTPCAGDLCTLQAAILAANVITSSALIDRIHFNLPAPAIVRLPNLLPSVSDAMLIDGLTQPGASCAPFAPRPVVVLDGTNAGANSVGFFVDGDDVEIRGVNIRNFTDVGIGATGNGGSFSCNVIGPESSGQSVSRQQEVGVVIEKARDIDVRNNLISGNRGNLAIQDSEEVRVSDNIVGTDLSGTRPVSGPRSLFGVILNRASAISITNNLISGNDTGIYIPQANNNEITENRIGTNISSTAAVSNTVVGIHMIQAQSNVVNGNIIAGNGGPGVLMEGISLTLVTNNDIGTTPDGIALGNLGAGVVISNATLNTIGGSNAGNRIAFNKGAGISVTASLNNTGNWLTQNAIYANAGLGIDLEPAGVTQNDTGDADGGPNNLQNFAVLSAARTVTNTVITGTLNSTANRQFRIEFFANPPGVPDPDGVCEGRHFVGFALGNTDGIGNLSFTSVLTQAIPPGSRLSATASATTGDTSEFSVCAIVTGPPPSVSLAPATLSIGEGAGSAQLVVQLSSTSGAPVTVTYSTSASGAQPALAGVDFVNTSNASLVIPAGQISATLSITILEDVHVEGPEQFQVTLSVPPGGNAVLDSSTSKIVSLVTITDNDSVTPPSAHKLFLTLLARAR